MEDAFLLRLFEGQIEEVVGGVVQREENPEEHEGGAGAQGGPGRTAEDGGPPQIISAAVDGFLIGDAGVILEEDQERQLGRRHPAAAVRPAIQIGEGFLREEVRPHRRQLCLKGTGVQLQVKDIADLEELVRILI